MQNYISRLKETIDKVDLSKISDIVNLLKIAAANRNTVFSCANGGSFCNSLHWAEDFLSQPPKLGFKPIKTFCLGANSGLTTCIANDYNYEFIFQNELDVFGEPEDILVAISGSGNSLNVLNAATLAKNIGMKLITFTGFDGGVLGKLGDVNIHIPCSDMGMVESIHLMIFHILLNEFCSI